MTDAELFAVFAHEYDENGMPVIDVAPEPIDERRLFKEHYRLNCITDQDVIDRDWKERQQNQQGQGRHR